MAVIATGFFDGVHLGHRQVIDTLVSVARQRSERSVVVTFWPHPRTVFQSDARTLRLLTSLDEKKRLLADMGVDEVEVLAFDAAFSPISTRRYLEEVVKGRLGGSAIVLGYDNRMGHDLLSPEEIAVEASSLGLDVLRCGPCEFSGAAVSSTRIRQAIADGSILEANSMLGYGYGIHGVVVAGKQLGRRLGFPTANMQLYEPLKMLPQRGVYLTRVETLGGEYYGMTNVGDIVETNIFDFNEDIYGRDITLTFLRRLRDVRTFDSLDALTEQLSKDRETCRELMRFI